MTSWIGNSAVLKSSSQWQLTLSQTSPGLYVFTVQVICKRCGNEQFILFPVFSTRLDNLLPFSSKLSCANSFSLKNIKFVFGVGLKEVLKLNNSVHDLFIFKICLIAIDSNF